MPYDPAIHRRHTIRLPDYDYGGPGIYFVTLCAENRACLFGDIVDGRMVLGRFGRIADEEWRKTPTLRPDVAVDRYVIMPNHVHGLLVIGRGTGVLPYAPTTPGVLPYAPTSRAFRSPSRTLGAVIRGFKGASAKRINVARETPGGSVWQRNYHEHIVRDPADLERIRRYIDENPARWAEDSENATTTGTGPRAPADHHPYRSRECLS